jgi:hypothetical protein
LPNENDPTVGFNVTGDNTFDLIVAQWSGSGSNGQFTGQGWSGYAWNGSQWIVNSTIISGLPTFSNCGCTADNFATFGYNILGNGKWDLIVNNYGNDAQGYIGFEWNGTAWTQENSLVSGLPSAGSPGNGDQFPNPCFAGNFANANTSTLIVGLASDGSGPNGILQGFQWEGTAWASDPEIVAGATNLNVLPNCPTIVYNVTGDGSWALIVGSSTLNPNQPSYYNGFTWSGGRVPLYASINPHSASINTGESITFNSTSAGGMWPYTYQWYVNNIAIFGAKSTSWTFTPRLKEPSTFTSMSQTQWAILRYLTLQT